MEQEFKFEVGQKVWYGSFSYKVIDRNIDNYSKPEYYLEHFGWCAESVLRDFAPGTIIEDNEITTDEDLDKVVKIAVTRKIELVQSNISEVTAKIKQLKDELKERERELANLHCNRGALIQVEKLL